MRLGRKSSEPIGLGVIRKSSESMDSRENSKSSESMDLGDSIDLLGFTTHQRPRPPRLRPTPPTPTAQLSSGKVTGSSTDRPDATAHTSKRLRQRPGRVGGLGYCIHPRLTTEGVRVRVGYCAALPAEHPERGGGSIGRGPKGQFFS